MVTNRLLFEWHSLDHVGVAESYESLPSDPTKTYDYFHINAVDVLPNVNPLVSARTRTRSTRSGARRRRRGRWAERRATSPSAAERDLRGSTARSGNPTGR